ARDIARNRWVLIFAANLVDFVDIYNALLRPLDIAIRSLQQFQDDVLDVFADVTGFRQGGGINNREGNTQHARQRLGQQRLAGSRRANQKDVCFLYLNVGTAAAQLDALVMLINRDRQALLGFILSDHVLIQKVFDLSRLGQRRTSRYRFSLLIVGNDLIADVNALITDIDGGAGNEFLDFVLGLAAEGTAQCVVGSSNHISKGISFEFRSNLLLGNCQRRVGSFGICDQCPIALNTFVTDKSALAYHSFRDAARMLRSTGHDVSNFAVGAAAERAANTARFHFCNHRVLVVCPRYSRWAITSSIKPYSLAWAADIIL